MVVEIVGGRWDGKQIQVPDDRRSIEFALPVEAPFRSTPGEPDELSMLRITMPLVLTPNGWRVYWYEG